MSTDSQDLDPLTLISLCAQDTQNSALWTEFVRRFATKIRQFVHGALRQSFAEAGAVQESDLFQNTIIRLVENDCAVLKRFSGTCENDFFAYLAVITRSTVRDFLRHQNALKRPQATSAIYADYSSAIPERASRPENTSRLEAAVLAREVTHLSERTIRMLSGESAERNWLIFQLHFYEELSAEQIARCKGIELSKAGVEKVLHQVKERVRALVSVGSTEAVLR